jgi:hypothetical protein
MRCARRYRFTTIYIVIVMIGLLILTASKS